jgi:hypothetical protein
MKHLLKRFQIEYRIFSVKKNWIGTSQSIEYFS